MCVEGVHASRSTRCMRGSGVRRVSYIYIYIYVDINLYIRSYIHTHTPNSRRRAHTHPTSAISPACLMLLFDCDRTTRLMLCSMQSAMHVELFHALMSALVRARLVVRYGADMFRDDITPCVVPAAFGVLQFLTMLNSLNKPRASVRRLACLCGVLVSVASYLVTPR